MAGENPSDMKLEHVRNSPRALEPDPAERIRFTDNGPSPGNNAEEAMRNYVDGGEAIVEALRKLRVDYIMSSPGSEWSPVWEALRSEERREGKSIDVGGRRIT